MNYLLALFVLFNVYDSPKGNCKYQTNVIESNEYTDSFYYHYNLLESILKRRGGYCTSIDKCDVSVAYFEKLTKIKAHPDGNFFGWYCFTGIDLSNWKDWYRKNYPTKNLKYFSKPPNLLLPKKLEP